MLDEFGLYPREEPFDPFSVMLFKALQVVAFLFFIALLAIAPEANALTFSNSSCGNVGCKKHSATSAVACEKSARSTLALV